MSNKEIREKAGLVTVQQVADEIPMHHQSLRWLIRSGNLPSPTHTWCGTVRKYYTLEEAAKIKKMVTGKAAK